MDKSIVAEQWKIRSNHRPILSEEEHDALVSWLEDEEGGRGAQIVVCVYSCLEKFLAPFSGVYSNHL